MSPASFSLSTPRHRVRPFTDADAAALCRIATLAVARNLTSVPLNWTEDAACAYIQARQWRDKPGFVMGIESEGRLIGGIGMGGDPLSCMYFLEEPAWGQGIATEVLSAFLAHMMTRFDLEEITADHFTDNPASGRVLEKVGFERTGMSVASSAARVEPCEVVEYRLKRDDIQVTP